MQNSWKRPLRLHIASGLAAASVFALAAPLLAEAELPKGSTLEDVQARQKLNEEQALLAREQLARNAASQAEFERRTQEVEAAKAKIAADDAAAKAAYEAEKARIEAQYAEAMAKWEADVAACNAGEISHCSQG